MTIFNPNVDLVNDNVVTNLVSISLRSQDIEKNWIDFWLDIAYKVFWQVAFDCPYSHHVKNEIL